MKNRFKAKIKALNGLVFFLCVIAGQISAQDLEPRAYVRAPIRLNVFTTGVSYSGGAVLTDASSPLADLHATVWVYSAGYVRTFNFFGLSAQGLAALPYAWVTGHATYNGQSQTGSRSGIGDARLRFAVLLYGAPAASAKEFPKGARRTVIGTSLTITVPTGLYFSDKLINIGTNRWGFKPELALSHSISKRWLLDVYAGVWIYTDNPSFFPGNAFRRQSAVAAFQAHGSYTILPNFWVAADATYYTGGNVTVNSQSKENRLSNLRWGLTVALPSGKRSAFKAAYSSGAYVVTGTNFNTVSLGWSHSWF